MCVEKLRLLIGVGEDWWRCIGLLAVQHVNTQRLHTGVQKCSSTVSPTHSDAPVCRGAAESSASDLAVLRPGPVLQGVAVGGLGRLGDAEEVDHPRWGGARSRVVRC